MALMVLTDPVPLDLGQAPGLDPAVPAAIVVPLDHPMARVLERSEAEVFPEAPDLFDVEDADVLFHFLVISLGGTARHIARLSSPCLLAGREDLLPFFLTDMVEGDPTLELGDVEAYYAQQRFDLRRSISVESQVRLGEHLSPVRSADLLYLSLFDLTVRSDGSGVFAHMNAAAISSFKRVGLQWHPFAGRVDLRTPTVTDDGGRAFDPDYHPVCVPRAPNEELLRSLSELTPELVLL